MAGITIAGIILSPLIVRIMFPGFSAEPSKLELTVFLNGRRCPHIFYVSHLAISMGILFTLHHCFFPAVYTEFLNLSIIPGARVPYAVIRLTRVPLCGGVRAVQ